MENSLAYFLPVHYFCLSMVWWEIELPGFMAGFTLCFTRFPLKPFSDNLNISFLGARAPLQLVHVKIKKKNTKKFQNMNYLLYLANCFGSALRYASMQVCKCASMPTSRNGHLPSLGWSPTNPRMVTLQKEFGTKLNSD